VDPNEPQRVQRFPRGLLHYLGLKGSGDAPHLLNSQLAGAIEIGPLYWADLNRSSDANSGNMGAIGYFAGLTVPSGELWIVSNLTCTTAALAAATSYNLAPAMQRVGTGVTKALGPAQDAITAQIISNGVCFPPYTLMLYPGDTLGGVVRFGTFGTPIPVRCIADYTRLEV
jgi:hypothetical protein